MTKTERERTQHLAVSGASGAVWIPALLAVTSCAVPDKAKKVHAWIQRGVESNEKPFWDLPLPENRREVPGLGAAFLWHLAAVSSMVVSTLPAELR